MTKNSSGGISQVSWPPVTTVGWPSYRYGSWRRDAVDVHERRPGPRTVSPGRPMTRLMYGVPLPGGPRLRRIEHDDVAPPVVVEARRQLVDEDVLVRLERALHRHLLDPVRLRHEVLDDEEDDEGQDERLDDLEETPEGAFAHKSGSIGERSGPSPPRPSARGGHRPAVGPTRSDPSVHSGAGLTRGSPALDTLMRGRVPPERADPLCRASPRASRRRRPPSGPRRSARSMRRRPDPAMDASTIQ